MTTEIFLSLEALFLFLSVFCLGRKYEDRILSGIALFGLVFQAILTFILWL